jgi:hypothetical protein
VKAALLAGIAYFGVLFGMSAAFGVARVLYVAPHFSPALALLLELPVMLAVAFVVSSWIADYLQVDPGLTHRFAMGGRTFILLIVAEFPLSLLLAGQGSRAATGAPGTWISALGFAAQAVASAFPLMRKSPLKS